jgi:hypothetical protein
VWAIYESRISPDYVNFVGTHLKTHNLTKRRSRAALRRRGRAVRLAEFGFQVFEVARGKRVCLEFVNDRKKVVKGADRRRSWSAGIAGESSCSSEQKGGTNEIDRDVAAVEFDG